MAEPFRHLQLSGVFPADLYAAMMEAMPAASDYRRMSGRAREARNDMGAPTRTKLDLFPEYVRHLPAAARELWTIVGKALCAPTVVEAFRRRLGSGLEARFGERWREVGLYAVPILTRDVAGYSIGIHPDTRRKGITVQLYLPRDRSIEHVGTAFHRRKDDGTYEKSVRMSFAPNTGYAFAVGGDTYHSVETLGPEVHTRDSILLTYFVDDNPGQKIQNRAKRAANFLLNEARHLGR